MRMCENVFFFCECKNVDFLYKRVGAIFVNVHKSETMRQKGINDLPELVSLCEAMCGMRKYDDRM